MNNLVSILSISPLRQRLIHDMTMRHFLSETQRNYIRDVGRFGTWLGRSPHTATAEDVRRFQIEQQELGVPVPTMNMIVSALRIFFTHTLDRPDLARKLVRTAHRRDHRTSISASCSAASCKPIRTTSVMTRHGSFPIDLTATTLRGTDRFVPHLRKSRLSIAKVRHSDFKRPHRRPKNSRSAFKSVRISATSISAPSRPKSKSP